MPVQEQSLGAQVGSGIVKGGKSFIDFMSDAFKSAKDEVKAPTKQMVPS